MSGKSVRKKITTTSTINKGDDPAIDRCHRDIVLLGDAMNDKDVDPHRRRDLTHLLS